MAPSGLPGYVDGDVDGGVTTVVVGVGMQIDLRSREAAFMPGLALRPSVALRITWNDPLRPRAIWPRLGVVPTPILFGLDASLARYGQVLTRLVVGTFDTCKATQRARTHRWDLHPVWLRHGRDAHRTARG